MKELKLQKAMMPKPPPKIPARPTVGAVCNRDHGVGYTSTTQA